MEMPEEVKRVAAMVSLGKIIETFADLTEAAEKASPEIKAFVKKYTDEITEVDEKLRSVFGDDYMDVKNIFK
jgi:Skp family chaperone for outer membrane proteins